MVVLVKQRQLQRKFKHAHYFGVKVNWSPANEHKFLTAINKHINDEGTQVIEGAYRNSKSLVTFYLNPETGLNVLTTRKGELINATKLSPKQVNEILTKKFLW